MCICCNVVFTYVEQVEESLEKADQLYADWEREWMKLLSSEDASIEEEYSEQRLWEDKIIEEAYKEYDSQKGESVDVGEDSSEIEGEE